MSTEEYLVAELSSKQFHYFFKNIENLYFSETPQIFSAPISAPKYLSGAISFLKRMGEYPILPYVKTVAAAYLQAEKFCNNF